METSVSALEKVMDEHNDSAEYQCIPKSGPQNEAVFEYHCKAYGLSVTATSHSKNVAKRMAAARMLQKLGQRGLPVPEAYAASVDTKPLVATSSGKNNYVAIVQRICKQYHLPRVEYELVYETGPLHLREFTIRGRLGKVQRFGTSSSKQLARQRAAELIYRHLRKYLYDSDEAARMRKNEKPSSSTHTSARSQRCDLGIVVNSEYHLGLTSRLDARTREDTFAALAKTRSMSPRRGLALVAAALRLEVEYKIMPFKTPLHIVQLKNCLPDLVYIGDDERSAAENAINDLRHTLTPSQPESPDRYNDETPGASGSGLQAAAGPGPADNLESHVNAEAAAGPGPADDLEPSVYTESTAGPQLIDNLESSLNPVATAELKAAAGQESIGNMEHAIDLKPSANPEPAKDPESGPNQKTATNLELIANHGNDN